MRTHADRVKDLTFGIARSFITDTRIGTGHSSWQDAQSWFVLGNEYQDFIEFLQEELSFAEVQELQDKFFRKQAKSNIETKKKLFPKRNLSKKTLV